MALTAAPGTVFAKTAVSGSGIVRGAVPEVIMTEDSMSGSGMVKGNAAENGRSGGGMPESSIAGTDVLEPGMPEADGLEADTTKADGSEDRAEGSGIVRNGNTQDTVLPGELDIDRTIGKNFIKQIFIECIGKDRSKVEALLGEGGEPEETESYTGKFDYYVVYLLNENEDVRVDYKDNIAVRIFGTNTELLNFEKDEYTLSEIDAILQVQHVTLEGNAYFWHLQDDPDVTIELVNGYASLNAY